MAWEPHLTIGEYIELGYAQAKGIDNFDEVEAQAQRHIDAVTNYYYEDHDIDKDTWEKRVDAYKAAICEQIDFIQETGITASYVGGDNFKNISIGRLSLSPAVNPATAGVIQGVCKEAYRLLGHYGLLYRGVNDYAAKNK